MLRIQNSVNTATITFFNFSRKSSQIQTSSLKNSILWLIVLVMLQFHSGVMLPLHVLMVGIHNSHNAHEIGLIVDTGHIFDKVAWKMIKAASL